jgi:hypothetical protein
MVFRTVPDAFDIWDDVEGIFVPRVNSPNERYGTAAVGG